MNKKVVFSVIVLVVLVGIIAGIQIRKNTRIILVEDWEKRDDSVKGEAEDKVKNNKKKKVDDKDKNKSKEGTNKLDVSKMKLTAINCGYVKYDSKFIAGTIKELEEIEQINNCDLSKMIEELNKNQKYIFFVQFYNTGATGYRVEATDFILEGRKAYFEIYNECKENAKAGIFTPYSDAVDGYCFIAAVPCDDNSDINEMLWLYEDENGEAWSTVTNDVKIDDIR